MIQKILLVFPVFSGIGLLTVRSWGILLFCTNALLLIIFNMYAIVNYPIQKNWMSLVEVILVTTFSLYILRKDIYIPFGKFSKRGFRYAKRKIIPRKLEIVSKDKKWELETLDLSQRGFRVKIPNCSLGKNSEVLVRIEMNNRKYEVKAGVVRIANPIVGIAFREMPKELRNLLNKELRK
ncbi:MAG: PilZ domain-containing protein [Leptospiraceae bacterium]|nr:PilZ domain-containing protein [Leptospiraceae bacterium]